MTTIYVYVNSTGRSDIRDIIGRAKRAPHWGVQSRFRVIIGRAKRAPHWGVQSRFRVIYICASLVPRPFYARSARWERDKGLVPVVRACVEFYWNPGKIVFFGIF